MVVKKKKQRIFKKTKTKHFDSFSEKSLKKYINLIKKVRKKKKGKKKKKVGLTNTISLLNLLYNVDRERKRKRTKNLMKAHPFAYPSLIRDVDVDRIWNSTKIPTTGRKPRMVANMNDVFRNLIGFQLLQPRLPARKLPKHRRGQVNVVPAQQPIVQQSNDVNVTTATTSKKQSKYIRPIRKKKINNLPTKPSRAPPVHYSDSDSDSDSSQNKPLLRKKNK